MKLIRRKYISISEVISLSYKFVEQHSWTYVAQKLILKPNQNNYDFGHTLLFYLSKAWMFNKPSSIASLNHTSRGQLVDQLKRT